ncbi:hypothetical protein DV711_02765 [Motiliproteus coralliicola]|uniref:UspA domain-containing protein n=1 Tax=Motiliproteus coralliicola TaxID=2283196 RepID=A0A369WVG1_9GAMM|nr:universal stress protein [Motiliproteus coralliicola]RDE24526.1 hypothetical protein DV711_02765 [Motiliproteus coralliicola]
MRAIEKILLLLDQQPPASELLDKVVHMARKFGARVELFECCYSRPLVSSHLFSSDEGIEKAKHGYLRGEERRLQLVADQLVERGVDATTDVCWEMDIEQGVLTKVERYQPDLVVKNCRFHHRLAEYLFGSLDWQLIRHCPAPLMLIRPQPWKSTPVVLAALDPLQDKHHPVKLDDAVLQSAESFVEHIGGILHMFHAYHTLPTSVIFDETLMLNYEELRSRLADEHRQAITELLNGHGLAKAEPVLHLAQGEVHKELPKYAEQVDADLVVLGGIDRNAADRLFSGSTTESVVDHLQADLLVIRAPLFEERRHG